VISRRASMTPTQVGDPEGLTASIERFLEQNAALATPFLVFDLDVVEARYLELLAALPVSRVLFAVKANPAPEVLLRLAEIGSSFDVASPGEIERCLKLGIEPLRLSYGNTIKKEADISYAFRSGVRTYTVDSNAELDKVRRQAPGSTVYVRVSTDGAGADWPLSRKFGCNPAEALSLLRTAAGAGHQVGLSFHVGSQQRDVTAWDKPLEVVASVRRTLGRDGIQLAGVNLGGGFPSCYQDPAPATETYADAILASLTAHLGSDFAGEILVEPGRYLVGDAGVIETEVVLISRRPAHSDTRWVYLDIGMFNGLTETLEEAIRYRVRTPGHSGPEGPVVLAGPSCDSADVLYETSGYQLPLDLKIGDRLRLMSTGAYTSSYSSVWFNGFDPLTSYFVSSTTGRRPDEDL
jgi:ornithine decarboxylase